MGDSSRPLWPASWWRRWLRFCTWQVPRTHPTRISRPWRWLWLPRECTLRRSLCLGLSPVSLDSPAFGWPTWTGFPVGSGGGGLERMALHRTVRSMETPWSVFGRSVTSGEMGPSSLNWWSLVMKPNLQWDRSRTYKYCSWTGIYMLFYYTLEYLILIGQSELYLTIFVKHTIY